MQGILENYDCDEEQPHEAGRKAPLLQRNKPRLSGNSKEGGEVKFRIVTVEKKYILCSGLKEACQANGISMRELAKRLGISPAYLCDISRGRRYVSQILKQNIERILKF